MVLSVAQWVPLRWPVMAATIWLGVSAIWLVSSLFFLGRACRSLQDATPAAEMLQQRARELAGLIGIGARQAPSVWMIPGAMSPLLWAIGGHPRLLIPSDLWDRLDKVKQDALLVHELAHLRRRDHWVRVLELAVTSLYWWCPVAWWVRRALRDSEERCCDAWVVAVLPTAARAYADALLDTVDFLAEASPALPLCASGLWRIRRLKERLALIVRGGVPKGLSRAGTAGVFGLAIVLVPLKPPVFAALTYRVTDLGTLGGEASFPKQINNLGQVVGFSDLPSGEFRAFRTAPDRPINPGSDDFGYSPSPGSPNQARPLAINDTGQVVGTRTRSGKTIRVREVSVQAKDPETDLLGAMGPTPNGGPPFAEPGGINARGQIVGKSFLSGSWSFHAFRTAPHRPIDPATDDLGTLGGALSEAHAVNAAGQVAGDSETSEPGQTHAFRTAANRPINPATDDLGSLGGMSRGYAINDAGQVAGWSGPKTAEEERHAFRTAPNRPINPATDDLGTLGGREAYGWGINNAGYVVGRSTVAASQSNRGSRTVGNRAIPLVWRAFLHDGKQMLDLNTLISPNSGWFLYEANDINDRGQIIGNGICPEGKLHGFVLTPVPEPGQLVLLGLGSALCGLGFAWLHSRGGM